MSRHVTSRYNIYVGKRSIFDASAVQAEITQPAPLKDESMAFYSIPCRAKSCSASHKRLLSSRYSSDAQAAPSPLLRDLATVQRLAESEWPLQAQAYCDGTKFPSSHRETAFFPPTLPRCHRPTPAKLVDKNAWQCRKDFLPAPSHTSFSRRVRKLKAEGLSQR